VADASHAANRIVAPVSIIFSKPPQLVATFISG
jgi:hypothetical protein